MVSSYFQLTLEVEALELGPPWLASVALGSNLVLVTSCRYPPVLGKAQRRILSIQQYGFHPDQVIVLEW